MSDIQKEEIITSISTDAKEVIPMYCDSSSIKKHEKNLRELFDLNFGKDGQYMLVLFYGKKYAKHHLIFNNPHALEKDREFYDVKRKAYYRLARTIMEKYFSLGKQETMKLIEQNKFRMQGSNTVDGPKTTLITSEIFDAMTALQKTKQQTAEDCYTLLNDVENRYYELHDKGCENGLTDEETEEYKNIKKKMAKLQRQCEILENSEDE